MIGRPAEAGPTADHQAIDGTTEPTSTASGGEVAALKETHIQLMLMQKALRQAMSVLSTTLNGMETMMPIRSKGKIICQDISMRRITSTHNNDNKI
jgi:hypothetical protein